MILVVDIQRATADHFRIPFAEMRRPDGLGHRDREYSRPRQAAMFLAKHLTTQPRTVVARQFSRDPTTLIHAERCIPLLADNDLELATALEAIRFQLSPISTAADAPNLVDGQSDEAASL